MISDKQLRILAFSYSKYDALICDGAIRSGKTALMMVAYVDWAMRRFNHQRFIILGKTVGSALRNVVEPYMQLSYARKRYKLQYRRIDNRLIVRCGDVENWFDVFGGKDESSYMLIQGFTAAGCLVDEVALCTQSAVNQALARCSVDGSRYWFNCNPDSPRHWFYTDWILRAKEHNALHLHFNLRDNPSLTEHIIERYESQYTGVFYQRYILGEWVVAEGLVYQFAESDYMVSDEEADGDGRGMWFASIDYGITNPFAALLWRVAPDMRTAYVVDMYYYDSRERNRRRTDEEHMDAVERLCGDRRIEYIVVDPSANSFKEVIVRRGRYDYWNANNDVLNGIQTTSSMIAQGNVKVARRCAKIAEEMQLYRWDDGKPGDAVIKEHDHAMDALRYGCQTVLRDELRGYND